MVVLRSLAFNTAFYANLIVQMIFWTPLLFPVAAPSRLVRAEILGAHLHVAARKDRRHQSGVSGIENLPAGSFILAPKHQSFWDAIAFFPYLRDPLYILKRELMWIPFFGWYIAKMRMIPVDRGSRSKALKAVVAATRKRWSTTAS